jgi:iron uptake system component EfeO
VPADVRPARPQPLTPRVRFWSARYRLARFRLARYRWAGRPAASRLAASRLAAPRLAAPGLVATVLVGTVLAAGLSGCGTQSSAAGNVITISTGGCGTGWHHVRAGMQTFQVRNSDTAGAEAYLINPASGAVFAEVSGLGPGTTRPMRLDLGSGSYAFQCFIQDTDTLTGPTVRVAGHHQGAPGILPMTTNDLLGPARVYHAYVSAGLGTLARQVRLLTRLIHAGRLNGARAAWLSAHLTYERLGAAYGTFGNYDTQIDGRPDGLPRGLSDPAFTGFYRIEYGLWHGQNARQLDGPAAKLDRDVQALRRFWPGMEVDLLDLGLRTHEILENALEFQLTGHDDYGSGTTLATTVANITGTRELLTVLRPLLVARYPGLPAVYAGLDRLDSLLVAEQRSGGHWTPVRALDTDRRQQIDAAAGQVLQELAPIAAITEPRR